MSESPQEKPVRLKDASFSVAARLAMQLGRESISNSRVAIAELVKNAYDADATNVRITFVGLSTSSPSLIIEDDGNGMTEDDIREHWFRIGTDFKLSTGKSPRKKRVLTGEKGLGRLGLDRLCRVTNAQFFSEANAHGIEVHLDWTKYEMVQSGIESIKHECFRISKEILDPIIGRRRSVKKGTRLILSKLNDMWDEEAIKGLKDELSLLVSPFGDIGGFAIHLYTGHNIEGVDGKITSEALLTGAEWQLTANLSKEGLVSYRMYSSMHNKEYKYGPMPWHEKFSDRGENSDCGRLKFEMYFFFRGKTAREEAGFAHGKIGEFLDRNQGIRIYRDGFRVKPYGDPNGDGDWLTLAFRRQSSPAGVRTPGWRVGYNQVVGAVFISKDNNPCLVDQTNREGIVEEKAYFDLRAFVLDAIRYFELRRNEFAIQQNTKEDWDEIKERAKQSAEASRKAASDLIDTQKTVRQILTDARREKRLPDATAIDNLLNNAIEEVGSTLNEVSVSQKSLSRESERREEEFQQRKDTLANLASIGILTACFGHETLASCNLVSVNATELQENLKSGVLMVAPEAMNNISNSLDLLMKYSRRIETFADFVLKNTTRDKRRRRLVKLPSVVRNVFGSLKANLDDKNIRVDLKLDDSAPSIRGFVIDWESILINLITNSVWAIVEGGAESKRLIHVEVGGTQKGLIMKFSDGGKGLDMGTEDDIFTPGFSTKRNLRGDVIGTGMGLTIVKGFIEEYDGAEINVVSPSKIGGAEFHIRIPTKHIE
jgi:signal transduction histidine kinase